MQKYVLNYNVVSYVIQKKQKYGFKNPMGEMSLMKIKDFPIQQKVPLGDNPTILYACITPQTHFTLLLNWCIVF